MFNIPNISFNQFNNFILPEIQENPVTCGIAWGASSAIVSHIFFQVASRTLNIQFEDRDFLINLNAILKKTSSKVEMYFLGRLALQAFLLAPISEELLFRGKIFAYVENNFSNSTAINFLVMPILFGVLHLDPRQKGTNLIALASTALLGSLLAHLRGSSNGLLAPISAHITHNLFGVFIGFAAVSMGFVNLDKQQEKKEQ